ncbi:OmpA family protein [Campylobacter sp. MG1]|uniref:OmpA family protein n=1 Tax=Campylobacter sp. MG1 TaxID=2976332 RepID=UPI00226D01C9|nr:OmpA family protein [Campylobacter sp. MG1]
MYKKITVGILSLLMFGCSDYITKNIPKDGIMKYDEVRWPKIDSAWIKGGTYPNIENLKKIKKDMTKDQIYALISHPHYSEGMFSPVEWDYLFNFISSDNNIIQCQYKIIFDKNKKAQSFFYKPKNCIELIEKKDNKIMQEKEIELLFDFDKFDIKNDEIKKLKKFVSNIDKDTTIYVRAHTDYFGSDYYNLTLAESRAKSVENELLKLGYKKIKINIIGEREQVKICANVDKKEQQVKCLKPNRRVTIEIK